LVIGLSSAAFHFGGLDVMALVIYRPVFLLLFCLAAFVLFLIARRVHLRWWPAWIARLLILGLILGGIFFPQGEIQPRGMPPRQVLLIDHSASLPVQIYEGIFQTAARWQTTSGNRLVIIFGKDSNGSEKNVDLPLTWAFAENIPAALDLAANFMGDVPGKVILASAGVAKLDSQVDLAIKRLVGHGHSLDIVSYWDINPALSEMVLSDVLIEDLSTPAALWEGSSFNMYASLFSLEPKEVVLQWFADGVLLSEELQSLKPGVQKFSFPLEAPSDRQLISLQVSASVDGDLRVENNTQFTAVRVYPPPSVLIVTPNPEAAGNLVEVLRKEKIKVRVLPPKELPSNLEYLNEFRVIFLHNFLAEELTQEQMAALKIFVTKQGGGLVFLGGRNSYTLGGYKNTLLEPILPVKLEPPPRPKPVTLVLMIDKSSSMKPYNSGGYQPLHLAKEAAMRVIETLSSDDMLGLMTYERDFRWVLPLSEVSAGLNLRQALDIVSQISASGGTKIYNALQEAVSELESTGLAKGSFIILLSDGKSADGKWETFEALAQEAYAKGITISTVALGPAADQETMLRIASAGKGRYYEVLDPADLPRIMLSESQAARNENIQLGATSLKEGEENHPVLAGMRTSDLPVMRAYNAVTSKAGEGAEDVLLSMSYKDPIFSVWQVGLGRVAAWMGDIGEEWSQGWYDTELDDNTFRKFWLQVVRYSLPDPSLDPVGIHTNIGNTNMEVEATVFDEFGVPVNFADPQYIFSDPEGVTELVALPQIGAGLYKVEMTRRKAGVYKSILNYQLKGKSRTVSDYFVSNYPDEYGRISPSDSTVILENWASSGGGQMISFEEVIITPDDLDGVPSEKKNFWKWLLVAVLILWPVEIAIRRRWLPWM
jgi:Ca-activated chloride channel homolog